MPKISFIVTSIPPAPLPSPLPISTQTLAVPVPDLCCPFGHGGSGFGIQTPVSGSTVVVIPSHVVTTQRTQKSKD